MCHDSQDIAIYKLSRGVIRKVHVYGWTNKENINNGRQPLEVAMAINEMKKAWKNIDKIKMNDQNDVRL